MDSTLGSFLRLLRPHLVPLLPVLLLVALLGALAALGQTGPIVLIEPLWPAMFPGESLLGGDAEGATRSRWVTERLAWLQHVYAGADADEFGLRMGMLYAVATMLALLGLVGGLAQYGFVTLSRWAAYRMVVELRLSIARHLMGLSLRYHGRRSFGDLLSRISADVGHTLSAIDLALKDLVQEPAAAMVGIAIAIYIAPQLTLVLLVVLLVLALPIAVLSKRVRKGSTRSLTSLGASVQALSQMFQGVRTVKAFRAEERELARYRELNRRYLEQSMRMVRAIALTRSSTTLLSSFGMAALLLAIGFFAIQRGLFANGGDIAIFTLAVAQAYTHLRRAANGVTRLQESMGAAVRLQALLDEAVDLPVPTDPLPLAGLGAGIRLEGVSFTYADTDRPALSSLDLAVRPGEKLAIVGASGSGKSTLMDLLARFIDPSEGCVTVDGVDLRRVSPDQWASLFAMVGQVPFLFHDTILENIRYGKPDADRAEVEAAACAASIHDFIAELPDGYATNVADAGSRLSGGQRQRIAIARAILKGAPLLLLDEATSALDSESERAVQEALDRLMEGRTVVVIAHRLSTVRNADRIAVLDDGRLVELGSHGELLAQGGVYARLFHLQQGEPLAARET